MPTRSESVVALKRGSVKGEYMAANAITSPKVKDHVPVHHIVASMDQFDPGELRAGLILGGLSGCPVGSDALVITVRSAGDTPEDHDFWVLFN